MLRGCWPCLIVRIHVFLQKVRSLCGFCVKSLGPLGVQCRLIILPVYLFVFPEKKMAKKNSKKNSKGNEKFLICWISTGKCCLIDFMHWPIKLCVCDGEFGFILTHYHHKTWNCQVVKYCVLSAIDGVAPMKQLSYSWIDRVPAIACTDLGFPRILFDNWLKLAFLIYVPARYFTTGTLLSGSFLSEVLTASSYGKTVILPTMWFLLFEAIDN